MALWDWLRGSPVVAAPPPTPVSAPAAKTIDPDIAFNAGFKFFLGPQFDGHLNDSAPGEQFTTKYGVTEMTYADALAKGIVTKSFADVQTPADVAPIYRSMYYDANRCGEMPACVAVVVFVDATLMGAHTPDVDLQTVIFKNLQDVVGAQIDGVIGAKTLSALAKCDPIEVTKRLEAADLAHLKSLPNWGKFGNGWGSRESQLLTLALSLA